MEMNEEMLGKVAGGKIVETKGGKFVVVPPHAKEFDTEEEAKKFEEEIKPPCCKSPHHPHHGKPHH